MSQPFALSAIGRDRPGIVSAITEVLFRFGCNIEDSAMTILWGQFAMLLVVTPAPDLDVSRLEAELQAAAGDLQLNLTLNPIQEGAVPTRQPEPMSAYLVSVYGADHPGIVSQTTGFLAEWGANITDLSTRVIQAKGPVYIMLLEVEAPARLSESDLKEKLFGLSQTLKVDISLRKLETESL